MSFSNSCWGVTVASISLHKAMLAFSLTLSRVSPSLECDKCTINHITTHHSNLSTMLVSTVLR